MGSHWLVPALFEHFERIGDVQMVAMLSCVLFEANHEGLPANQQQDKIGQEAFSMDFCSVASTVQNRSQAATPASSAPKEPSAIPPPNNARPSSEVWRVDSTPPHSTGTTPPIMSRPRGITSDRKSVSHSVSMAASPEQQSQPRSGPGFGSVLASSLSRSFTFGPSSASPPANMLNRKKPNPVENPSMTTGPTVRNIISIVISQFSNFSLHRFNPTPTATGLSSQQSPSCDPRSLLKTKVLSMAMRRRQTHSLTEAQRPSTDHIALHMRTCC